MRSIVEHQAECQVQADRPTALPDVCRIQTAVDVLGGKWKLLLISYLSEAPMRYGELRRRVPFISEKMLIQALRELEADGVIERTQFPEVPPRVSYAIAEAYTEVVPLVEAVLAFGEGHLRRQSKNPKAPLAAAKRLADAQVPLGA
jgi:DNA-binding HxlR family transcriptional regulator